MTAVCPKHSLYTTGKALHVSLHILEQLLPLPFFPEGKCGLIPQFPALFQRLYCVGTPLLKAVPLVLHLNQCLLRLLCLRFCDAIGTVLILLCLLQRTLPHGLRCCLCLSFFLLTSRCLLHNAQFALPDKKRLKPCVFRFIGLAVLCRLLFQCLPPGFCVFRFQKDGFLFLPQLHRLYLKRCQTLLSILGQLFHFLGLLFQALQGLPTVQNLIFTNCNGGLQLCRFLLRLLHLLANRLDLERALLHAAIAFLHLFICALNLPLCILVLSLRLQIAV